MRRLCTWLPLALAGVVLLAGCGSGSKSTSSGATSTTTGQSGNVAGGTTSGGTTSGGTTSGSTTGPAGATAAKPRSPTEQVEACKRAVLAPSPLPASAKAKLLKSCEHVGGNPSAQRQVVREACEALASSLPAGARRERLFAICHRT